MTHTPQHPTARPGTAQPHTAQSDNPLATIAGPISPNSATTTASPLTAPPGTAPGPAQPTVPLAVWYTPVTTATRSGDGQPGGVWTVPPLLAQHLLAVYTAPGGTVLAVGGSARTLARTATRLDRRPPVRGRNRRAAAGSVDLLVLTPAAGGPTIGDAGEWRRWPQLLAPTGILAVVLPPTRAPGDPAAVIAAAAGAGLTYLQHAVAVLWPLHDDHLDPPTHPRAGDPARGGLPASHADVLLFTQPPIPEQDPEPGAEPGAEPGTDPDGQSDGRQSTGFGQDRDAMTPRRGSTPKTTSQPATTGQPPETGAAPATSAMSHAAVGSVWPVAQNASRAQRTGRYLPAAMAHPGKMLPALARTAIVTYTGPSDLVLDPMCGIGTTLIEAVHAGRDAVGVEYEPRWAALARDGISHAVDDGASGHAAVAAGDARHTASLLGADVTGRVRLLLTSPPYGSSTHGRVNAPGTAKISKWNNRYSGDGANLAHRPLPELLDGFAEILRACLPLLAPDGTVVLTTRPYRQHGRLIDLPGAALYTAVAVGLEPVGRYVALLAGIRGGRLVPRASFFQLANVRGARRAGVPLQVIAHEDVLVLRKPAPRSTPASAASTAAVTLTSRRLAPPLHGQGADPRGLPRAA